MGDYESRLEDARIEAGIDRCLRNGTWGYCKRCGEPTPYNHENEDTGQEYWLCRYCQEDNP